MDGGNYTFNGLGEYVMVDGKDGKFQLQARTGRAQGNSTTATIFIAGAAKEENTSTVEVRVKPGGNRHGLLYEEYFEIVPAAKINYFKGARFFFQNNWLKGVSFPPLKNVSPGEKLQGHPTTQNLSELPKMVSTMFKGSFSEFVAFVKIFIYSDVRGEL